MNDSFKRAMKFVSKWEGGKCDDPKDKGGRTAYGVTQKTYDAFRAKRGLPDKDVWDITQEEIDAIYWEMFWVPAKCDILPDPLDLVVFDSSVQHGPSRAIKWLQAALGVNPDGMFGPKSVQALHEEIAADLIDSLVSSFISIREQFYKDIISRDSTQLKFERGWGNRMAALKLEAFELA